MGQGSTNLDLEQTAGVSGLETSIADSSQRGMSIADSSKCPCDAVKRHLGSLKVEPGAFAVFG